MAAILLFQVSDQAGQHLLNLVVAVTQLGEFLPRDVVPSHRDPQVRARVPDGWKVVSAQAGNEKLKTDDKGTVDISSLKGKQTIHFRVRRN